MLVKAKAENFERVASQPCGRVTLVAGGNAGLRYTTVVELEGLMGRAAELQACNGTAHFVLALPAPPAHRLLAGRVVTLSSEGHRATQSPDFSDLTGLRSAKFAPNIQTDGISTCSPHQYITAVEGIVPTLQNVVAIVNLNCRLDLRTIARKAEYNPKVGTVP
ncbi:hypothetical protein B0H14DRAFT_3898523 [Mycena olivaceomarginata]|nr:hypothetical protein B0H14DRAFT_3898523 [Mycena olivaceomarginata]